MLNIAVLVSGGGTNLGAIIKAAENGQFKNGRLALVISSKAGVYALERAAQAGIPAQVIPRRECATLDEFDRKLLKTLEQYKIDLVVLAGFLTIFGESVVERYPNRIINVHPALLPSFGGKGCYGLRVHEMVLESGVKLSGATVHFVTRECDAGPIILQKAVEVLPGDTPQTLQRRVMEQCEWELLPRAIAMVCGGGA